jgi:hypothetical protein
MSSAMMQAVAKTRPSCWMCPPPSGSLLFSGAYPLLSRMTRDSSTRAASLNTNMNVLQSTSIYPAFTPVREFGECGLREVNKPQRAGSPKKSDRAFFGGHPIVSLASIHPSPHPGHPDAGIPDSVLTTRRSFVQSRAARETPGCRAACEMAAAALIIVLRMDAPTRRLRVSCSSHWGQRRSRRGLEPAPPGVRGFESHPLRANEAAIGRFLKERDSSPLSQT